MGSGSVLWRECLVVRFTGIESPRRGFESDCEYFFKNEFHFSGRFVTKGGKVKLSY